MNPELVEVILEDWFKRVSNEFPPEVTELIRPTLRRTLLNLLTGEKGVLEVVSEIDEDLLKKVIKSGSRPADFIRRAEILMEILSSRVDETTFSKLVPIFARFQIKFLEKLIGIYEETIKEEITERRRVERALRVLSRVNQAVLQAEDEKGLLESVCRIIVNEGYIYSWIGYAEKDKTVRPMASAGLNGYASRIEVTWDESETGMGPTGRAIRERIPSIARDIATDKTFQPWREEALKRGYASSIALPLIHKDEVFGALNVYSDEKDAFDEEESSLLREVAENLAYGIAMLREKKEMERIERLYKTLIENTGTGMILLDKEGNIIFVNEEVTRETGFAKEELIGRHFIELLSEDEKESVLGNFKLRLIDPESVPKSYEVRYIDAKGEIRYGLVTITLLHEQFIVSLIDVTELKKIERELRVSESRYKTIFDASPLAIILTGIDMAIYDCNEAALKLLNRSREEVAGKKWTDLGIFDEKELPLVMEIFYKRLKEGRKQKLEPFEMKIKVSDETGTMERWLRMFLAPLEVANKPYAVLIIIEDITDIKLSEKKLADTLEQLKILRSIDLGVLQGRSVEDMVVEVTGALKQKIGHELVCISPLSREVGEEGICSLLKDRKMVGELRKRRGKDGIVKVESVAKLSDLFPLEIELLKAGMRCYILIPLTARDEEVGLLLVASRKKICEEDIYFINQLAGQLAIALHEALLFEEKRKAFEQIEENIEEFAILVDHIRNPLAIISGTAELHIKDENVKRLIEEAVNKIEETIARLDRGWLRSEEIRNFLKRY
ncbi:hypothetical protein DRP07_04450 [Archaeoglobales archaeon]|nr:MAG: hypothetical protein DRP07_04450 [Archaeoglobales archaeon]